MDTQTQIERLIELAIVQRTELKELVAQLPQLREHLSTEIEKAFDEAEPQLRAELEEWTTKQAADKTAALGVTLEAKIADLAKSLEVSTQARYNAIIAEREQNARLAAQAEAKIAEHAASLPSAVKDIVTAELARFPRAGEIDQLRKEFAEPRGLNPRGKWQAGETYNKLDLVTINGDSYTSNTDGNRTRPSRSSADWTLVAARGTGGGGGPTSLSELTTVPSDGDILIGSGTSWVTSNLTAGAGISITVGPGAITISATDGDITLDDGTAASPSLHFTNDPDTGIYRPAANTLGISVSGTQVAYFDENGLTVPSAGVVAGGSIHAGNGNANNPSLSFDGDQDTGFFRHQANEIGIALGGTQYATLTSTTFSITPVVTMASSLRVNGTTDSSNKDTGAIVTEGGLGVEKSATIGGNLTVSGTGNSTFSGNLNLNGTDKSILLNGASTQFSREIDVRIAGDTEGRLLIRGGGSLLWGDGAGGFDSTLARTAANMLTITGGLTTSGNLTVSGSAASTIEGTLGLNCTPVTWYDNANLGTALQIGAGAGIYAFNTTGNTQLRLYNNAYLDNGGAEKYLTTGEAFVFEALGGEFRWKYASSGTAGNAVTLGRLMTLFGSTGNLLVGSGTSDGGQKLQVAGSIFGTSSATGFTSLYIKSTGASSAGPRFEGTADPNFAISIKNSGTGGREWQIITTSGGTGIAANGSFALRDDTAGTNPFIIAPTTGNATFAGSIAIGNTVNTVSPTSPNRTITMVIGGTTYYIHAKTTND